MPSLIGLPLLPLIAALMYAFVLFDRLVRAHYENHRDDWEKTGRPAGFFWRAVECHSYRSHLARARLSLVWLLRTPAWIAHSPALAVTLRRLRLAVVTWNVGILTWLAAFVSHSQN